MSNVLATPEKSILLENMPWQYYENLMSCFQDVKTIRFTYLDGGLEIMSPVGEAHENYKRKTDYRT